MYKKRLYTLSLLGLAIAVYLVLLSWNLVRDPISLCLTDTNDCMTVYTSNYSKIFGISMASIGVGFYIFILVSSLTKRVIKTVYLEILNSALIFASFISVIMLLPLSIVMFFLMKGICVYCLFIWIINILIFIIIVKNFQIPIFLFLNPEFILSHKVLPVLMIVILSFSIGILTDKFVKYKSFHLNKSFMIENSE